MAFATILTSPNGINWTVRPNPWDTGSAPPTIGFAVADNGANLVAISDASSSHSIETSPSGIVWTGRTSDFDNPGGAGRALAWSPAIGGGIWLAGGDIDLPNPSPSTSVNTSTDSITWTNPFLESDGEIHAACWASPYLVLGVNGAFAGHSILTTNDGTTYNGSVTSAFDVGGVGSVNGLAFNGSRLVAGGFSTVAGGSIVIQYSDDEGVNWTGSASPLTNGAVNSVCWSAALSLWVAVGVQHTGVHLVMTSPDAVTWTVQSSPMDSQMILAGVCWSDTLGLFCAVGTAESFSSTVPNLIMTSPDAVTWTLRTTPIDNIGGSQLNAVTWVDRLALFVTVGQGTINATPGSWILG